LCAVALVGNYIFWIENLRLGFRDRRYSMPVGSLFLFLPHDGTFVAMYPHWFHTIHHWFPELWWCGLCVTVMMELTFLVMLLKFGRAELAPRATQAQFTCIILFGLALSTIAWLALKSVMQDELFLVVFGLTIFWCVPFNFALMAARGSAVGQSRLAWCGFLLMPAFYWPATWILSTAFHSLTWNALGAACIAGGLANLWLINILAPNTPVIASAAKQPRTELKNARTVGRLTRGG